MRILGIALCTAALALSSGGVYLQPAAAGEPAKAPPLQEYPPVPHSQEANSCPRSEQPLLVTLSLESAALEPAEFENLNTRGYNYPAADDAPGRYVPDSTGLPPEPPRPQR
jgi:hypothetical protein